MNPFEHPTWNCATTDVIVGQCIACCRDAIVDSDGTCQNCSSSRTLHDEVHLPLHVVAGLR